MTKITIHGQKMQYHKVTAISVTLTSGTGGTATFFPETGTSYTLSSLPIGSKIAKAASSLYVITNSSGTTLGSISLSESPGYEISDCDIVRGGVHVAISNTTLEDGDTIEAVFKASTMRIKLYNNGLGTFYNELTRQYIPDGGYADIPRADVLEFKPYSTTNGIIEIYKDGDWTPVIDYTYSGQQAYILAFPSSAGQVQPADFAPKPGTTYVFPALWNLQDGYQYLDGSLFSLQDPPTPPCEVVELQSMSIQSNEFTQTIESYVLNNYSFIKQIQQWRAPNNGNMIYTFYDSMFHMVCSAVVTYLDRNGQLSNTEIVTAFSTDRKGNAYCSIYDREGHLYDTYGVRERPSNLVYIPNIWADVYQSNTSRALDTWVNDWNCGDTCGLIQTIYNLATNK